MLPVSAATGGVSSPSTTNPGSNSATTTTDTTSTDTTSTTARTRAASTTTSTDGSTTIKPASATTSTIIGETTTTTVPAPTPASDASADDPAREVSPAAAAAQTLTVGVSKLVDAGSGFQKVAIVPGPPPPFYKFVVTIANTNAVPVYLTSLTDEFPLGSTPQSVVNGTCPPVMTILQPNQVVTCTFMVSSAGLPSNPGAVLKDKFKVKVARGATPVVGGVGGESCADINTSKCIPPCLGSSGPPPTTTTTIMVPDCVGATEEGGGEDTAQIGFQEMFPERAFLAISKTNDANGDGNFTDAETALTSGQTVPFRIFVTNNSTPRITYRSCR